MKVSYIFFLLLLIFLTLVFTQALPPFILLIVQSILYSILFFLLYKQSRNSFTLPYDSTSLLFSAIFIWLVINAFFLSPIPDTSLFGFYIFNTLILPFWICFYLSIKEKTWKKIYYIGWIVGIFVSCYALLEAYIHSSVPKAFFAQSSAYASFLGILVFPLLGYITCAWHTRTGKKKDIFKIITLNLLWIGIFISANRGSFISISIATVFFLFQIYKILPKKYIFFFLSMYLVSFLLTLFVLGPKIILGKLEALTQVQSIINNPDSIMQNNFAQPQNQDLAYLSSIAHRIVIWKTTLSIWHTLPWYGLGPGTFLIIYPSFQLSHDKSAGQYAHNDYLQILIELGYPGFILYLLLGFSLCYQWLQIRTKASTLHKIEADAIFASFLSLSIHNLIDFNFYIPSILFPFAFLLSRLHQIYLYYHPQYILSLALEKYFSFRFYCLLLISFLSLILITNFRWLSSAYFYSKALQCFQSNQLGCAQKFINYSALTYNTSNIECLRAAIAIEILKQVPLTPLQEKSLILFIQNCLKKAQLLNPYQASVFYLSAQSYNINPTTKNNILLISQNYKKAIQLQPQSSAFRFAYASFLANHHLYQEALNVLSTGMAYGFVVNDPIAAKYQELLYNLILQNSNQISSSPY